MIIKGKLGYCKREKKTFEGRDVKEKLYISLKEVDSITKDQWEQIKAIYAEVGKKFTPEWVKNFKGYVNLSSQYSVPVRQTVNDNFDTEYKSIEDLIDGGFPWYGAEVKVSINLKNDDKNNAIYPNSIIILTEGTEFNAFAEFDSEEED